MTLKIKNEVKIVSFYKNLIQLRFFPYKKIQEIFTVDLN